MKLNLPNKLTVLRMILVPIFVVVMMVSDALWASITGLCLFVIASLTDMLDGKIARRHNLITDFGKFMDPLADKFMVLGAMLVILYKSLTREDVNTLFCAIFFWAVLIVIFRETCTQIACVIACIAEPLFYQNIPSLAHLMEILPLSLTTAVLMLFFTLWSGINYIASYWKYLDPEK